MAIRSINHMICFILTALIPHTVARFAWNSYPTCAQPILEYYAPGACDLGLTGNDLNRTHSCLCSNREFLDSTTTAVHIICGCDDLSLAAGQLTRDCSSTNTPAISSLNELIAIATGDSEKCAASPFSSVRLDNSTNPQNISSSTDGAKQCPKTDLALALGIGIPGGLLTGFGAFFGLLQLLVYQRELPRDASPWPVIRRSFRHWFWCLSRSPRQNPSESPDIAMVSSESSGGAIGASQATRPTVP